MGSLLFALSLMASLPSQAGSEVHIERASRMGSRDTALEVALYLTVLDREGRPIRNLGPGDFQLIVNSRPAGPDSRPRAQVHDVKLAPFEPTSIAVVSQVADMPAMGAVMAIRRGLPSCCVSFHDALDIDDALSDLRLAWSGERKLLVYLSDGVEAEPYERIAEQAARAGIVIDTVGCGKPEKIGALELLAKRTAGVARVCSDTSDLWQQLGNIHDEIRDQYVMDVSLALSGSDACSLEVVLQGHTYSNTITVDRSLPTAKPPEPPGTYYFLYATGFLGLVTLLWLAYRVFGRRAEPSAF